MLMGNIKNLSEKKLIDILVASTPVAYIVLDKDFRIHFINDYFLELRQLKKEEVLGDLCYNLSNKGKKCAVCAVGESIKTGKKSKLLRKDVLESGTIRYIDDYAIPLYDGDNGEFEYILEIMVNRDKEMQYRKQLDDDFNEIIHVLSALLEAKDEYTALHSKNVRIYSVNIAQEMKLPDEEIFDIDVAASLHDIGKVFIPTEIINKTSSLTDEEFNTIKSHPVKSRTMIDGLSGFQNAKKIVELHHERFDGSGYPKGFAYEQIPIGARIVAVADAYDAMTSTRSYRRAMPFEKAVNEIRKNSGTQFDPVVVEAFLNTIEKESLGDDKPFSPNKQLNDMHERTIRATHEPANMVSSFKESPNLIQEENFIESILKYTPVSYVILDMDHNVLFASDYFFTVMGLEKKTLDKKQCYFYNANGEKCPNCIVDKALQMNETVSANMKKVTKQGNKYFYVYAVPVKLEDETYVIEIMIDRTEEYKLRKQHEHDLTALIKMLSLLLYHEKEENYIKYLVETSVYLARVMGLSDSEVDEIQIAASLCEIGMISAPKEDGHDSTEDRYRLHPQRSKEILNNLSGFDTIKEIILHHHENYDGSGYPDGLIRTDIPLGSRIITMAHVLYENHIELNQSLVEKDCLMLMSLSGCILDPEIVYRFLTERS